MNVKVTGKGLCSPIGDGKGSWERITAETKWYKAAKPDFNKYFEPKSARRTSNILKMSLVAAYDALNDNHEDISGIMVGTGLGCIGDSEKFLNSMIEFDERSLSPTPFIQSTHNTIAGVIALKLQVHQYNFTYSDRVFSFEWALLDAMLQLRETKQPKRFLVGSADEVTPQTHEIAKALGIYNDVSLENNDIVSMKSANVIAGEHAAFFTVSNSNESGVNLQFVKMFFQKTKRDILSSIKIALRESDIEEPDCIFIGINGHKAYDKVYNSVLNAFPHSDQAFYKHLSGENLTASSFALWLAVDCIESRKTPKEICLKQAKSHWKNALVLNHLRNDYFSAIFVSR
jgi:hypothetical protein